MRIIITSDFLICRSFFVVSALAVTPYTVKVQKRDRIKTGLEKLLQLLHELGKK